MPFHRFRGFRWFRLSWSGLSPNSLLSQVVEMAPLPGVQVVVLPGGAGEPGVGCLDQGHLTGHRLHVNLTPGGEIHRAMHPAWRENGRMTRGLDLYSRLAAAHSDRVQAGALQTACLHPGVPQGVVSPLILTQRWGTDGKEPWM